jgi:hypothetical protein
LSLVQDFLFYQEFDYIASRVEDNLALVAEAYTTVKNRFGPCCSAASSLGSDTLLCHYVSKHLKTLLSLILRFGNYLNGGTKKGQAYGFKLSALEKVGTAP